VIDASGQGCHNVVVPELEPEYRRIGEILRRLRRERDLSQETLAASCCISRSALANIESGQQRLAVHQLLQLARALHVPPIALLPTEADASSAHPVDEELVQKGVPEAVARAVAKIVSDYEGGEIDASAKQSRKGGSPAARRSGRHRAAGSR
jgi:transcriptional regulator with XRE-family HTH domain